MFNQFFAYGTLKNYVIYFGTLFSNIQIERDDTDGTAIQTIKVPLSYGPKEKFLARLEGNPNIDKPVAMSLPRMSFEIKDIVYDATRHISSISKVYGASPTSPNKVEYQYAPVPYNIHMELSIMVKNAEDGTRIVEQILPFFSPQWTASIRLNPAIDKSYDVPIVIDGVEHVDTYEGNFIQRRALIWTLYFTMKGYLFGPTKEAKVIKEADINLRATQISMAFSAANPNTVAVSEEIIVYPGLTANGQPTSNSALTINKSLISSTDDYGYITDFVSNIE